MPISQLELTRRASAYSTPLHESMEKSMRSGSARSAFLCHSHKDQNLVKGLVAYFQASGVELYVDWQDLSMPETPNADTARKIQHAISERDYFLFLATANAATSRWCPWEIGYADASARRILIVPTSDALGTYGSEYLQLYSRIDEGHATDSTRAADSGLAVFAAGRKKGEWLRDSLR